MLEAVVVPPFVQILLCAKLPYGKQTTVESFAFAKEIEGGALHADMTCPTGRPRFGIRPRSTGPL